MFPSLRPACLPIVAVVASLAVASPAFAQLASSGAIAGSVQDASGSSVGQATVVVHHVQRDQRWASTTDRAGRFRFGSLPIGDYEVTVTRNGFTPQTRAVTLTLGATIDVPFILAIAGVEQAIQVSASPVLADVATTAVGERVSPREVEALPLNGRNVLDLALLVPGVSRTNTRNTERFAETSAIPGTGISMSGQRNLNNAFVLDGFSANDDAAGLAGTYVSQDAVRELTVITSGGNAEYGRASGGVVSMATRSGTSRWLGRGYGFFRDAALDARNAFATGRDPLRQVQAGASLGGPLRAERTFLFVNGERTHQARTGFVSIAPGNVDQINARLARAGYAGPRVTTGGFGTGYDATSLFARVDHQASASHQLMARYLHYDIRSDNARNVGGLTDVSRGTALDDRDQAASASSVITWGSALNEARVQVTRSDLRAPANDPVGPAVTINGVASFGVSTSSPTGRRADVYEAGDTIAWQRGSHLWKTGAVVLVNRLDIAFPGALPGAYTFGSLQNFLAGRYVSYQQAFGDPGQFQSNPNVGLFVQDTWRAGDRVTVDLGLRYDLQMLPAPIATDANNVAPRLGVAWASRDHRTVVRFGGGVYYDRLPLRATSNALQRDGVRYRVAVVPAGTPGAPDFPATLTAFPGGLLTSITTIDPHIQESVGRQARVEVEHQLGARTSASLAVLHLSGRGLIMSRNINVPTLSTADAARLGVANLGRPDQDFANITQYQSLGRSRYDALTAMVSAQPVPWASVRASYTLARALDDAGNAFFSAPQDNGDVHADWGPSDNDQRHRLTVSGAFRAAASGADAPGGWQAAWVFGYASAYPFNVQTGTDRNNDTTVNDRPAGVGRNSARGFDAATLDLRVSRVIAAGARRRVEVLAEAFNVLNRVNRLFPNNIIGAGTTPLAAFGRPTAAGDPRQVQLGVRVDF